jgi:hypothetical protein
VPTAYASHDAKAPDTRPLKSGRCFCFEGKYWTITQQAPSHLNVVPETCESKRVQLRSHRSITMNELSAVPWVDAEVAEAAQGGPAHIWKS